MGVFPTGKSPFNTGAMDVIFPVAVYAQYSMENARRGYI